MIETESIRNTPLFETPEKKQLCNATFSTSSENSYNHENGIHNQGPLRLEYLLSKGLQKTDIVLLNQAGFCTVESVAYASNKALLEVKGISEQRCEKYKRAAKQLVGTGFCSATKYLEARDNLIHFTTGSVKLDELLGGGIETGSLTELFGEFRTGKTQLCYTLAVTCQLPVDHGGGEGKCLWIDTEGTFRPERIQSIAERFQLSVKEVLENIVYGRAFNTDHQMELITEASALMVESRFSLLIVDSATSLYRSEYIGRSELAARQNHLLRFLRCLQVNLPQRCILQCASIRYARLGVQRLSDTFGVAVVMTNQVCAKVDMMPSFGFSRGVTDKIPIGGHIMAHCSQTRLALTKGKAAVRYCKVYDSPCLPESDAPFCISSGGIMDVQEESASRRRHEKNLAHDSQSSDDA